MCNTHSLLSLSLTHGEALSLIVPWHVTKTFPRRCSSSSSARGGGGGAGQPTARWSGGGGGGAEDTKIRHGTMSKEKKGDTYM